MNVNGPGFGYPGGNDPRANAPGPPQAFPGPPAGGWPPGPPGAGRPAGIRPEIARAALAAAAGAVAAIILWFLAHGWSLLFDALLGVWVGSSAVSGWKSGTTAERVEVLFNLPKLPSPLPAVIGALACLPLAVGLLSMAVTDLHHSSRADVCSALSAYQAASDNTSVSDSAWFAALSKVGNAAADYAGPDQAAVIGSGRAALQLANGSGNSDFVMTSVGQADDALAPVMEFCNGN